MIGETLKDIAVGFIIFVVVLIMVLAIYQEMTLRQTRTEEAKYNHIYTITSSGVTCTEYKNGNLHNCSDGQDHYNVVDYTITRGELRE